MLILAGSVSIVNVLLRPGVGKDKTMTKKNVTVNYNGEPLKADEVLVFTPYDEEDVKNNVTNKESIVTITKAGKSVKAVLKAVPKEFETVAKAQFNSWHIKCQDLMYKKYYIKMYN